MKALGIDYGTKRIGLALSDETLTLAREYGIYSPDEFWSSLEGLIAEEQITQLVLGWPIGMSGQETQKTAEVQDFKSKLEHKTSLPVVLIDERLSSAMAESITGGKENIDSFAAMIILQNYLDNKK